ncbi:DnaJ domain-containing protein [Petrocella sp. FN5]|uniref:DnaJ domain-containing protein n=1 Tax=Petrocella sp. FN5 TaxID=3032002 RepID=UPI0023DBDF9A|nr:DnaJ domain-containing protein [Petrocella sp. FN5]MDF1618489.1 DnaJ domain-containing protein [Petrocella sp. FN5]
MIQVLTGIISGILSLGFTLITLIFNLVLAIIVIMIMTAKGRNGLLWGIATFFFPWMIFIVLLIPRKIPRFKSYLKDEPAFAGLNPVVASIMGLAAIVAKSDGHVSTEEIQIIRQYIAMNFQIAGSAFNAYEKAFNYGKIHPEAYVEFARVIRTYHNRRDVVLSISYLLVSLVMHDHKMTDMDEVLLVKILAELGLTEYEYMSIKRYFTQNTRQHHYSYQNYGYNDYADRSRMNSTDLVSKYSKVLGVSEKADLMEIKKAYRKLAKEHHPDKISSEGMPEDYKQYSNQRIVEINEAYEYLKKVKTA